MQFTAAVTGCFSNTKLIFSEVVLRLNPLVDNIQEQQQVDSRQMHTVLK